MEYRIPWYPSTAVVWTPGRKLLMSTVFTLSGNLCRSRFSPPTGCSSTGVEHGVKCWIEVGCSSYCVDDNNSETKITSTQQRKKTPRTTTTTTTTAAAARSARFPSLPFLLKVLHQQHNFPSQSQRTTNKARLSRIQKKHNQEVAEAKIVECKVHIFFDTWNASSVTCRKS